MLKFLKNAFSPERGTGQPPKQTVLPVPTQDAPVPRIPDKDQLFFWWATDNFGEVEGRRLYKGVLEAERIMRSIQTHGDFVTARQSLLNIAMLFPDASTLPCAPPESVEETQSIRDWRELMNAQYANSAQ